MNVLILGKYILKYSGIRQDVCTLLKQFGKKKNMVIENDEPDVTKS